MRLRVVPVAWADTKRRKRGQLIATTRKSGLKNVMFERRMQTSTTVTAGFESPGKSAASPKRVGHPRNENVTCFKVKNN